MGHLAFLACGPSVELLLILGGLALGSLVLVVSFLVGFLCLFTSRWKLGLCLTTIPAVIAAVAYILSQQQKF
jgi:hypothetical protein